MEGMQREREREDVFAEMKRERERERCTVLAILQAVVRRRELRQPQAAGSSQLASVAQEAPRLATTAAHPWVGAGVPQAPTCTCVVIIFIVRLRLNKINSHNKWIITA